MFRLAESVRLQVGKVHLHKIDGCGCCAWINDYARA